MDVLPKSVKAYNDTVHTTNGMATSRVTDADVLTLWRSMEARKLRVRVSTDKFRVGSTCVSAKRKLNLPRPRNTISVPKYLGSLN